ncbi:transcription antitermination factor NusB [Fusibacter sp. 3D3]|uniref:transcription antitermination factor NusB n=1 Tax=Fusibacter sp. 3D3 TaxID=1048380 RepID=UPI0008531F78|nr:transcription antitermination factor NusB [Fusibacter sp. 3D3]GAU76963.1 transcription termination protein NusB [Fusibacter sp. 3D3]
MNRSRSREIAMEVLYQMDIHNTFDKVFAERMIEQYEEEIDKKYVDVALGLFIEKKDFIDGEITPLLKKWTLERLSKIDLAILRIAVTELKLMPDIPDKVTVNEAINMSKKYVDEKSGKFINGLLKHFINPE